MRPASGASAPAHLVEGRRVHQLGPALLVDRDVEPGGESAHRGVEIARQVRVVDEDDVRFVAARPGIGEVPRVTGKGIHLGARVGIGVDPGEQPFAKGRWLRAR
jgi:hypothetical protein